ncbi:hypothetical protein CRENBAI_006562 [Crenichthys baileyi]|uniref:Uncharacterized protein n=1 Tax=Crenichthys baileyi TaxID=28760 RepID=A0AAV9RGC4_9TELE
MAGTPFPASRHLLLISAVFIKPETDGPVHPDTQYGSLQPPHGSVLIKEPDLTGPWTVQLRGCSFGAGGKVSLFGGWPVQRAAGLLCASIASSLLVRQAESAQQVDLPS